MYWASPHNNGGKCLAFNTDALWKCGNDRNLNMKRDRDVLTTVGYRRKTFTIKRPDGQPSYQSGTFDFDSKLSLGKSDILLVDGIPDLKSLSGLTIKVDGDDVTQRFRIRSDGQGGSRPQLDLPAGVSEKCLRGFFM